MPDTDSSSLWPPSVPTVSRDAARNGRAIRHERQMAKALARQADIRFYHSRAPQNGFRVCSGPFKDMLFNVEATWGNVSLKWLGQYEQSLHDTIYKLSPDSYQQALVLGSAEGYYAAGLTRLLRPTIAYAFDIDEASRRQTQVLCQSNSLNVEVGGRIRAGNLNQILSLQRSNLVFVDIEGDEHEILDLTSVPSLASSEIVCELHEFYVPDLTTTLLSRFRGTHDPTVITQRDVVGTDIPQLSHLSDIDRALILCELRPRPMTWLHLKPRHLRPAGESLRPT